MKKITKLLSVGFLTFTVSFSTVFAQAPEKMSYQAVIRNTSDALVTTQAVGMQISILEGGAAGSPVYVEIQTLTTNANGLVSLEIGTGTVVSGDFTTIDWANNSYFIKIETDPTGGTTYTITGTSQLMSVPYALRAKTAANGITSTQATILGNTSGTNTGNQNISRTGTTVTLTNGGTFSDSVNTYTAGTNITISAGNVISAIGGSSSGHYVGELFGGGIVYYVYNNGANGLIASLDDLDGGSGVEWSGNVIFPIGVTAESMTNGAANTIAMLGQDATANKAGTLCDSYAGGGFTDWYLPSNRELYLLASHDVLIDLILDNDGNPATNGFTQEFINPIDSRYWSSTENSTLPSVWVYSFAYGNKSNGDKYSLFRVRAVRAF